MNLSKLETLAWGLFLLSLLALIVWCFGACTTQEEAACIDACEDWNLTCGVSSVRGEDACEETCAEDSRHCETCFDCLADELTEHNGQQCDGPATWEVLSAEHPCSSICNRCD